VKQIILRKKKVTPIIFNCFIANKDEDGHVIIGPRNFTTKPPRKGRVDAFVLFKRPPSYNCNGDLFKNPIEH
jgi:hypothetical protein